MVAEAVNGTLTSAGLEPRGRGVHPRRQRVRAAVHRAGAARRDARHGRAPAVGQAGRPARGGLRLGQRRGPQRHRRDRGGAVRLRAGARAGAGAKRPRCRRAEAPGRGRLDRPRGPGRQVHVAVHVQPAGRRVRPAVRPERRAPARHRRAQHAQRQGQPAGADAGLDVRPGRLRRRRPRQPGRRGPAAPHRLRSGHRRGGRRAAGLRPLSGRTAAENHAPASPAGGTAPPRFRCSPSSTAARGSPTSSRTSARS